MIHDNIENKYAEARWGGEVVGQFYIPSPGVCSTSMTGPIFAVEFGEPGRMVRVNPRVFTPGLCCVFCGRWYKGVVFECAGCGAPT